jgi:surfactin synthase thioesterase subunit
MQWSSPRLRKFHPSAQSKVHLVCLPHAGGSASLFRPISESLGPSVEVLAVEYSDNRSGRVPAADELADAVFRGLRQSVYLPVALFGHGMGAAIAFQVAMRLEQVAAIMPTVLFVSSRRAPLCTVEASPLESGLRLSCPIVAMAGGSDPQTAVDGMRAWGAHTSGSFDIRTYPGGGHSYLVSHQSEVINEITDYLLSASLLGDSSPYEHLPAGPISHRVKLSSIEC